MRASKLYPAALCIAQVSSLRVGVISDLHSNIQYDMFSSATGNCWASGPLADEPSPWARYGCDPSPDLVDGMMRHYIESFGVPDVLLVSGDNVAHGINVERGEGTEEDYEAVKDNIATTAAIVRKYFSDTIVLNTLGNNDAQYHNQAPDEDIKSDFYSFLFDQWFTMMPGNSQLANDGAIYDSIMTAGFYRVDLSETLSVLVLNAQYFELDNETEYQANEGTQILDWLEDNFVKNVGSDRKFIILDHVYAGARFKSQ